VRRKNPFLPVRVIGLHELAFAGVELVLLPIVAWMSRVLMHASSLAALLELGALVIAGTASVAFMLMLVDELRFWRLARINRYPAYIALSLHTALVTGALAAICLRVLSL
jgi:hypothetical protein